MANTPAQSEPIRVTGVRATGYSQVVIADMRQLAGLAFVSGQVALDSQGRVIGEGDFGAQCRYVFEQLANHLSGIGSSMANVLKVTVFLRDFANYQQLVQVRQEYFGRDTPPASSAIGVASLVDDRLLIELEAVAVVPPPSVAQE